METDPPAPENSDQAVVSTTEEQVPSQPARSYECTFCKRGFSNAQALGGHMNIHRKDKAKLKHASNETPPQQLVGIPKSPPSYPPVPTNPLRPSEFKSSTEEKIRNKWPWIFSPEVDHATSRDETHSGQLRQLPLFAENQEPSSRVGAKTEKGVSSSQEPSGPELDLELRLGHEPQDSSAATGMKKFF